MFHVIIATTAQGTIGKDNKLPWAIPEDMKMFKAVTTAAPTGKCNAVVMGRLTFESMGSKALSDRFNVVVTSKEINGSVYTATSLEDAMAVCHRHCQNLHQVFVIGGARLYEEALRSKSCKSIYWTRVQGPTSIEGDVRVTLPIVDEEMFYPVCVSKSRRKPKTAITFDFCHYLRRELCVEDREKLPDDPLAGFLLKDTTKPVVRACPSVKYRYHEEFQYLDLIAEIINRKDSQCGNRTGIDTLSGFGRMMRFDLRETFPLLTTKRVFWKGVLEELLWFVRGETNGNLLSQKGVKIWDANGSREFLDKRGFHEREVGDLGPIYGFQWRHFGADYKDMFTDYTGQGVDQLRQCIEILKKDPYDRRILLSAWNPAALHLMALPPCHMFCQFYVDKDKKLSCAMYQRSADLGLGVPFNIASYSLLTRMVAQVTGLLPGEFVHFMGNAHVYVNHIEPLKEQLKRTPRPFPHLKIDPSIKDIDEFKAEHFKIVGYSPYDRIDMEMAV